MPLKGLDRMGRAWDNALVTSTRFQKDGPKRRRRTRRELPYGQLRMWGSTVGNFKRERIAKRLKIEDREI